MFITPTARETRDGESPRIRLSTTSSERIRRPDSDPEILEGAAKVALRSAFENGYQAVAYSSVEEFMRLDSKGNVIYVYIWMFTAWDETDRA